MFSVKFLMRKGNTKLQVSRFDGAAGDALHPRDVPLPHTGRQHLLLYVPYVRPSACCGLQSFMLQLALKKTFRAL